MLAAQAKERQKIYCGNQYDKKSGLRQNSVQVQKSKIKQKKQMLLNRLNI